MRGLRAPPRRRGFSHGLPSCPGVSGTELACGWRGPGATPSPQRRVPAGSRQGLGEFGADVNQTRGHACSSWLDFGFSSSSFMKGFQSQMIFTRNTRRGSPWPAVPHLHRPQSPSPQASDGRNTPSPASSMLPRPGVGTSNIFSLFPGFCRLKATAKPRLCAPLQAAAALNTLERSADTLSSRRGPTSGSPTPTPPIQVSKP